MIKKTYIPSKPRNPKLIPTSTGDYASLRQDINNLQGGADGINQRVDRVSERVDNIKSGTANLLLNTGFLGDFKSLNLDSLTTVLQGTPVNTNPLIHWVHSGISVIDAPSRSGKGVSLIDGTLQQTVNLKTGTQYVLSFWAKGEGLNVAITEDIAIELTDEYTRYSFDITASQTMPYTFTMEGTAEVYEPMFSEGNVDVGYSYAEEDDVKAISQLQAINVITDAIKNYDTDILGGLILTSMLQLGKYKDGVMEKVNAGINGIYNNDDDPAIWAGGTFNQAISTVQKFKDNPSYQPTEEEWSEMAKMVLTHGGDGFFRGYIHALGGIFRGKIESNKDGKRIIIDPATRTLKMTNSQGMLLTELAFSDSIGDNYSNITLHYYDTNDVRRRTLVVNGLSGIRMMEFAEDGDTLVNTTAFRYDRIIYKGTGVITGEPPPGSLEPYQLWHDSDGYVRYMKPPTE